MQDFNLDLFLGLLIILCNLIIVTILIVQLKYQSKIKFKLFTAIFLGTLLLLALVLNLLIVISQETYILVVETIEIIVLQLYLIIFTKKIWRQSANLTLFAFSTVLFGLFRASGMYRIAQLSFPEPSFNQIAFLTAIFYQFFFIISVSLISIFILFLYTKMLSKKVTYSSVFSFIWGWMFIFGLFPFIDLLFYNLGLIPGLVITVNLFIGLSMVTVESYGTVLLYLTLALSLICEGVFLGYKHGFKLSPKTKSTFSISMIKYLKIGAAIIGFGGIWYSLILLIFHSATIIMQIVTLMEFIFIDMLLIHPFWLLLIIYGVLLLIPHYVIYLIYIVIQKRENLWEQPNQFNTIPILNLCILVFSGFILCYNELKYPFYPFFGGYLQESFIAFVIYFYLGICLLLLTIYVVTYQKKSWSHGSFSIKMCILFIPFILGYFFAGQILSMTELLFGILCCASIQIYAVYLHNMKLFSSNYNNLNRFIAFFWGILSICFAGLLSISNFVCTFIILILFYVIIYQVKRTNISTILYGLIGSNFLLMGATTSSFVTNFLAIGIPNITVFGSAFLILIGAVFYQFLQK